MGILYYTNINEPGLKSAIERTWIKNSFSINIYTLMWRTVCEWEVNQIMVDKLL